jgi:CheY-like chemotaxis protein
MELYRQHLKGVRLLLVEDNEINMDLATELLEDVGAHVDAAVNGIMAVEMTQGQSYDLVLMDIQMPEMDGLTATREIRTRVKADELPIVAMTAHAIKGEYEKSLAAGMNDHITKPIDPDVLYRTLVRHIRGISLDSAAPESADRSKSSIQITGLKYEEGLKRSGSKQASYHALLLKFSNRYVNVATEVRTMVMNGDVSGLADYLHTLAGVSGNVGATEAYELSSKLSVHLKSAKEAGEQKIRVDLISQMQLLTVKLDELITSIRDKIRPEIADRSVGLESVEVNWTDLVIRLKASISENDSIALDLLEQALAKGGNGAALKCLREVQVSLSDFNFDKALEEINRGLDEGLFR